MKPLPLLPSSPFSSSSPPLLPPLHPPPIRAENTPIRSLRAWSFPNEEPSYQAAFQTWWLTGTFETSKESLSFVRSLKGKRSKKTLFEAFLSLPTILPPVEPRQNDSDPLSRLAVRHLALGVFDVDRVENPPPSPPQAISRSALRPKPPPPKVLGSGFVLSWLFVAPVLSSVASLKMASDSPLSSATFEPSILEVEAGRVEDLIRYALPFESDLFSFFETRVTLSDTLEESVQEVDAAVRHEAASAGKLIWFLRPLSWGLARRIQKTYGV